MTCLRARASMVPARSVALSCLLLAGASLVGCGDGASGAGGPLAQDGPFLSRAEGSVRALVLTAQRASAPAMLPEQCSLRADLFDATSPRSLDVQASEGECRLYAGTSDLALGAQRYVCAGAVFAQYGSSTESLVVCPAERPVAPEGAVGAIACAGLSGGAPVRIYSEGEFDADTVADLNAMLALPGEVTVSEPTNLGVVTWPASGDLTVRWTSANATSAVVTIEARAPSGPSPRIVCLPRTNGQVTIAAALLQQSNLRGADAVLRVASYRDATVTAEGARSYRVSAGIAAPVLLQARR